MPDSIENYVPQNLAVKMRRQALVVWGVFGLVIFAWLFAIVLAPIAETNDLTGVSNPIYRFFSFICHQIPDRSFHVHEHAFAVCSRCFGVYFGLFFGFVIYPLLRRVEETEPFPRFWLFLAMIPMGVDWSLGFFDVWANTHFSRFTTGAILGTVCGLFIVPALVELFQLLASKRQGKKLSV
ncbi:MAG: DUF2085 domain-containing protein [Pyrinomonadaceae bacterium]|nr:DUF2085 domain-containing protein [Pyrinomonadaceae bacterium]